MNRKSLIHLISRWADWFILLDDRSAIGYPSQTVEAMLMIYAGRVDGKPASSIVPNLQMSPELVPVDRAIRGLAPEHGRLVIFHHAEPGKTEDKIKAWCAEAGKHRCTYFRRLNKAYDEINGCLT